MEVGIIQKIEPLELDMREGTVAGREANVFGRKSDNKTRVILFYLPCYRKDTANMSASVWLVHKDMRRTFMILRTVYAAMLLTGPLTSFETEETICLIQHCPTRYSDPLGIGRDEHQ